MNSPKASAPVIVSAILAIVGSLLAMLILTIGIAGMYGAPTRGDVPGVSTEAAALIFGFMFCMCGFGAVTGVGLLRLKNWARISILTWAGISVVLCSMGVITILLIPLDKLSAAPNNSINMHAVKVLIAAFYTIPILIGVWWLILFTRSSVKAQFVGTKELQGSLERTAPHCPLPVTIIAGFMLFSVLGMFLMPLMHMPVVTILFGHRIRGEFGNFLFATSTVLYLAAAIGLLRLKRWSYPLSLGLYAFWTASGLVTILSPGYGQLMTEVLSETQIPQPSGPTMQFFRSPVFAVFTLIPTVIIMCILLYYRRRFWAASESTSSAN
jgi:hypothetical protein